jgi:hypothetical protein
VFIWTEGHKTVRVATWEVCPACRYAGKRCAVIHYDYSHFFRLFKGLKNKSVQLVCEVCGEREILDELEEKELFGRLGRNPIPLMDRYGAHVLLAIVAAAYILFDLPFPCVVNPTSESCAR